jgi:hypothetical protein
MLGWQDSHGKTALHYGRMHSRVYVLLKGKMASSLLPIKDKNGKTAADYTIAVQQAAVAVQCIQHQNQQATADSRAARASTTACGSEGEVGQWWTHPSQWQDLHDALNARDSARCLASLGEPQFPM